MSSFGEGRQQNDGGDEAGEKQGVVAPTSNKEEAPGRTRRQDGSCCRAGGRGVTGELWVNGDCHSSAR